MASLPSNPLMVAAAAAATSHSGEVYVAAVALRATKGPAQLVMSAAYALKLWELQHFMVILKPFFPPFSQAIVYDFQPQDPENIFVALNALSGRSVPGIILVREMRKIPRRRCWFVGPSIVNPIEAASQFNTHWNTHLQIGYNDCRHYTNGKLLLALFLFLFG